MLENNLPYIWTEGDANGVLFVDYMTEMPEIDEEGLNQGGKLVCFRIDYGRDHTEAWIKTFIAGWAVLGSRLRVWEGKAFNEDDCEEYLAQLLGNDVEPTQ